MLAIPIIGDIWDSVTGFFADVAGAAIDSVIGAVTSWVMGGVLAAIEAIWEVIDNTTRVETSAEWFSLDAGSPVAVATAIGVTVTVLTVLLAVIRAVVAGSPGGVLRVIGVDLPMAVFAAAATVGVSAVLLNLADAVADWVWDAGRGNAAQALENIALTQMTGLPGSQFLGVLLSVMLLLALVFVWIVLFVRQSLIYIVVVLALAFAWPVAIFPALRDTARKTIELLVALIVSKPVMVLAMSVGISALGGVGATAPPAEIDCDGVNWAECAARHQEQATVNLQVELGALITGVVAFGLAAFMPFLVWRLMPLATAAVVAQGVASGPLRAGAQAMQWQYYTQASLTRFTRPVSNASAGSATVSRPWPTPSSSMVPTRLTTSGGG
jgi:hypothetical protein